MKIWFGYGSEHSANLVMIGTFKDIGDAQEALDLLNEATEIARADEQDGLLDPSTVSKKFSPRQMAFFKQRNLPMNYGDPEQLLYDFSARREGERVVVTTDEYDVQAMLKVLLHKGAKIEVYSAHDHPGQHGR
jgi:hypothetical protein